MPTYNYKAKDRSGNTVTGALEARDEHEAAAMVREKGCLPMDIRATGIPRQQVQMDRPAGSPVAHYLIAPLWTGVNIRALAFFYSQLATLLGAGMSIGEALKSVSNRMQGRLKYIIVEMQANVSSGRPMSETMARYPRIFSSFQLSMIKAGESGGLLQGMVERISSNLDYEMSIRRNIAKMMFYPILILIAFIVIPHMPTLILQGGAAFRDEMWASVRVWLPWAIGAVVGAKLLMQFEVTRYIWDGTKILFPVLGTTARKIAMSRFSRAFAALYSAGMNTVTAISVAADACANVAVGRGIKRAVPALQAGEGLTESLAKTGAIMPMVMDMLSTGERTGSMDVVLQKVADYADEEVDATLHKTGIMLFVVMILIMAVLVTMKVVAFYGGMFNNIFNRANQ